MQVLFPTLVSVCFKNKRVCEVVAEHVSMEMIVMFIQQSQLEGAKSLLDSRPMLGPRYHIETRFPTDMLAEALAFFQGVASSLPTAAAVST